MDLDTIRGAVCLVLDGGLVGDRLCIVWHAGEPLVLPVNYYEEAFSAIDEAVRDRCEISHSFQTNGTLIDDRWCRLFKTASARIGLSIDGQAFLHDLHRKSRRGGATHAQTMRGAQKLQDNDIPFHVIAVVSADSLDHATSIFQFFEELKVTEVGFNVEELEGSHLTSSLKGRSIDDRVEKFWSELYDLTASSKANITIREFKKATQSILTASGNQFWQTTAEHNDQVLPFRIISVDIAGGVSTFSPELIGIKDPMFGNFTFGRIGQDDLATIRASDAFQRAADEIWKGVNACANSCEYFLACGGGAPSNKYFENGSLSSTTTMYCRNVIQAPLKIVLERVERKLNERL